MTSIFAVPAVPLTSEVWNLLRYDTVQIADTDRDLNPATLAGARADKGVTVIQFGAVRTDYWVMVTCPLSDTTSWSPFIVLQFFIGERWLSYVNSVYVQDLENLTVVGYFSNGLPLP